MGCCRYAVGHTGCYSVIDCPTREKNGVWEVLSKGEKITEIKKKHYTINGVEEKIKHSFKGKIPMGKYLIDIALHTSKKNILGLGAFNKGIVGFNKGVFSFNFKEEKMFLYFEKKEKETGI